MKMVELKKNFKRKINTSHQQVREECGVNGSFLSFVELEDVSTAIIILS